MLMTLSVTQGEGVVEFWRFAEVKGAGGGVPAVVRFKEVEDVSDLRCISCCRHHGKGHAGAYSENNVT